MNNLFRTTHALAKKGRPFSDFVWQVELDEKKGTKVGTQYRTDKKCSEFASSIAAVEKKKLHARLEQAKFLSFMMDGATDVSTSEQELLFARHATQGKVTVDFIGIEKITSRPNAHAIKAAFDDALQSVGMDADQVFAKLVSCSSDGASVMLGKVNGVMKKLQEHQPAMLIVHCLAHRLELAFKDALKLSPVMLKVEAVALVLYKTYKKSPTLRNGLREAFQAHDRTMTTPTRVGGTRWLPHLQLALSVILEGYRPIMMHLSQVITVNKLRPEFSPSCLLLWHKNVMVLQQKS